MEIVPLRPGGPALDPVLQDYRRRYGLDEMAVLNALMGALSTRQAQALLSLRQGRAVGVVVLSRRGDKGEIELLHALSSEPEAPEALLAQAELALSLEPGLRRISASLPAGVAESLSPIMSQHGYHEIARARMVLELAGLDRETPLPPGYRLEGWSPRLLDEAAALLQMAHAGTEDEGLYPEISSLAGARRLVERALNWDFGPFDPALVPVIMAGAELVGLALVVWHAALPEQGFVLDLGVAAGHRRRGLGEALVLEAAKRFQAAGAHLLGLAVTLSNEPARRLYERLGFQVEQRFGVFWRDWPPGPAR